MAHRSESKVDKGGMAVEKTGCQAIGKIWTQCAGLVNPADISYSVVWGPGNYRAAKRATDFSSLCYPAPSNAFQSTRINTYISRDDY